MPDLQPDTSIYQHEGLGGMSLPSLMGLVQSSRALSTQSGIADAMRANPNDPGAAYKAALQNPNVFIGPREAQEFTGAQSSQFALQQGYTREALGGLTSFLSDPKPTADKFINMMPTLEAMGIPHEILARTLAAAQNPDGSMNKSKMADLYLYLHQNQGLPTVGTVNPETHQPTEQPIGTIIRGQAQGGGPAGGGQSSGATGSFPTAAPPYQAGTYADATKAQTSLQDFRSTGIAPMRQMLDNLHDLSNEAATGPGADWQVNWSKLMHNIGLPQYANLTPDEVKSSENFKKISERLVNQMATTGGHITNDFLHNAYGSNPSLEISRQGREGMISWLHGIADVQNLVGKNFQSWLNTHPGGEGQFYKWASGQMPGGMNVSNLDMRVFQFERMSQPEQDKFLASMKKTPGEYEKFMTHHQNYDRQGWLDSAKQ